MAVFLHLGAHKTATTHLQRGFQAARQGLAAQGVRWIGPARLRRAGLPLKSVAEGGPGAEPLRAALRPPPGGRLIVSEENLLGPALRPEPGAAPVLYAHAPARLARVLAATGLERVTLALAVREPAAWVVSQYSQRVSIGRWLPWEAFTERLDPAALDWSRVVAGLLAVPGVAGCLLWRYEDYPAVLPAVLARLLPEGAAGLVVPPDAPANAGLSAAALAMIAAESPGRTLEARRALVAEARARHPKGPDAPGFAPWPEAVRHRAAAAHAADLARLEALPGVERLRPEG